MCRIDKIGIVCCSNGQKKENAEQLDVLAQTLEDMGIAPVFSPYIYEKDSVYAADAQQRAQVLMDFYADDEIKGIFDISGGDLANGILPYLDYDLIARSEKLFWGYSDLTSVINGIYTKTGKASVLYQIRNLVADDSKQQITDFRNTVLDNKTDLFDITYDFLQGSEMQGIVVGGNIRCFLKLAGTEYFPDLNGKVLLLESYSGGVAQMEAYLSQLQQLGAFKKVSGILLGTFTQMEKTNSVPDIVTMVKRFAGDSLPIAVTRNVGHGFDSKAIMIGKKLK
nr:LD-carboxypeptidase [Lachnospiraceae bacterium]